MLLLLGLAVITAVAAQQTLRSGTPRSLETYGLCDGISNSAASINSVTIVDSDACEFQFEATYTPTINLSSASASFTFVSDATGQTILYRFSPEWEPWVKDKSSVFTYTDSIEDFGQCVGGDYTAGKEIFCFYTTVFIDE